MGAITSAVITAGSAVYSARQSSKVAKEGRRAAKNAADAQLLSTELSLEAQKEAEERAVARQQQSTQAARGILGEYADVGKLGLQDASFLTDSQQQYDWLQNNPLYQASLEEAQRQTLRTAGATGRLSAGDTLADLSKNVMLSAQPLIADRVSNIQYLLGTGQNLATSRSNVELGLGSNLADLAIQGGNAAAAAQAARGNIAAQQIQQNNLISQQQAASRAQMVQGLAGIASNLAMSYDSPVTVTPSPTPSPVTVTPQSNSTYAGIQNALGNIDFNMMNNG